MRDDPGGFSPTAKKLRLAAGQRVAILNAPDGYLELLKPGPAEIATDVQAPGSYDAVQLFVNSEDELRRLGPTAIGAVKPDGLLWITYPRTGAGTLAAGLPATPSWTQRDVLGEITSVTGYRPVALVAVAGGYTALRFKRA
jgi:hypothetical protein